jgi:RNA polymerase primary sigma factor
MVESMQRSELDKVLKSSLKPTERAAVRLRFGLDDGHPRTLREVGELLSVSKERVRQVIFSALSKLKTPEVRTALVDYLS